MTGNFTKTNFGKFNMNYKFMYVHKNDVTSQNKKQENPRPVIVCHSFLTLYAPKTYPKLLPYNIKGKLTDIHRG